MILRDRFLNDGFVQVNMLIGITEVEALRILYDSFILHYRKGNRTESQRRALILHFRPEKMIKLERAQGVDHTGDIKVRNEK